MEVTFALTGHMLVLGGAAKDMTDARRKNGIGDRQRLGFGEIPPTVRRPRR